MSPFIYTLAQRLNQRLGVLLLVVVGLLLATPHDTNNSNESLDQENSPLQEGLIYARVSSSDQVKDEADGSRNVGSLDTQISEGKEIFKDHGIELSHPPIKDKAQTGTDFDRDGIQKIFRLAQRDDVGYLFVQSVDRIGRSAAETLYFIYILQSECNVTLITPGGERDIGSIHGLMHTTLLSLMGDVQNELRTTKAKKSRVRGFIERKKWNCYSPVVPVGYNQDGDGWLKLDDTELTAVESLFDKFIESKSYTETAHEINNKYEDILDGHRVKTLLQNPVYIGKPQLPEEWVNNLPYDNVLDEPGLKIIDENTFQQAQKIVEEKNQRHSTDEDTYGVSDFIEEFDLFSVIAGSPPVTLVHDCGETMVKTGKEDLKDVKVHVYWCSKCRTHRKWPKEAEYDMMELLHKIRQGDWELFDDWDTFDE